MKDKTNKMSLLNLKSTMEKLNPKTLEPCYRGSLLEIFGTRYFDLDFEDCEFTLRVPFSDYGDLVLTSDTFYHLVLVYSNIIQIYPEFLDGKYDPDDPIQDLHFSRYTSLRSLFEFLLTQSVDLDSFIESFQNNLKFKKVEVNT